MSDNQPKSGIPAWQRAPSTPATEDPVSSQPTTTTTPSAAASSSSPVSSAPEPTTEPSSSPNSAHDAPAGTPTSAPEAAKPQSFNAVDVDQFHHPEQSPATQGARAINAPSQPAAVLSAAAPPIITYPEYLVNAHRPPPLITPTRLLNTLYVAGGLAALIYGTSKYLIEPMVEQLHYSRHQFFTHSQSKVDEFNERLSKIVSKVPAAAASMSKEKSEEVNDTDSIASDPTELYHRDMGTQTEVIPPSAPRKAVTISADDAVTRDTHSINTIRSHLDQLLSAADESASVARERLDSIQNLRHYLDTMAYASAGITAWTTSKEGNGKTEDAIEELKKEIRGVKGVLLSAKRFPSYASNPRAAGSTVG